MTLQDLIDGLARLDASTIAPRGFHNPHSWRGVYAELAFEPTEGPVTVGEMLATAQSALGQTYEGWKGGDYTMSGHTEVHIDYEGQYGGADMVELWLAALATARPTAPAATAEAWVSVLERLPEPFQTVWLVVTEDTRWVFGHPLPATYRAATGEDEACYLREFGRAVPATDAMYWMPRNAPTPPTK